MDKARDDIQVIGLAYEEIEHADMVAFLKDHPMSYPIAVVDVYEPPADFDTPRGLADDLPDRPRWQGRGPPSRAGHVGGTAEGHRRGQGKAVPAT